MSDLRDPLIEAIHVAGEVPPPPDRDAAFARAMRAAFAPSRRRLNRGVIALFAAALLAVPAAVFAERATNTPPATIMPITFEKPDPGSSIQHEADDSTVKRESASREHSGSAKQTDDRSGTSGGGSIETDHSGDAAPASSGQDDSPPSGGGDAISTPAPTPVPSVTLGTGSPDGSSPDGGAPGPN
jgi:hypothetical protein